jgi:hypothetical protein
VLRADKLCHLHVPIVLKSGGLNLLEPSGPVKACNGNALPLLFYLNLLQKYFMDKFADLRGVPVYEFFSTLQSSQRAAACRQPLQLP